MEKYHIVPDIPQIIVECRDLEFPILEQPNFIVQDGYTTVEGKKRYCNGTNISDNILEYFSNLVYKKVIPCAFTHKQFVTSWPISPQIILKNTKINVIMFQDEIGWHQSVHEDPKIYFMSGVVHAQDSDQGTTFCYGSLLPTYIAPSQQYTGSFWVNGHYSQHYVSTTTKQRMGYLITVAWTCFEPYDFSGEFDPNNFYGPLYS